MFDSSFFFHLFPIMFRYIDVTLGISLAALLLALLIAVVIAAAYYLNIPGLKQVCAAWVSLFRGTPLLAQLFWICYGLPQVIVPMQRVSVMTLIIWGVAFNASSYMSETLRGALSSVSSAQIPLFADVLLRYPLGHHVHVDALGRLAPSEVGHDAHIWVGVL